MGTAIALAIALATAPSACAMEAGYDGTAYRCPDGRCPLGFECVEGVCSGGPPEGGAGTSTHHPTATPR